MNGQAKMEKIDAKIDSNLAPQIVTPRVTLQEKSKAEVAKANDQTPAQETKMEVEGLSFYYGRARALKGISLTIRSNEVTAFIGPSGCGKSTLIRTLNRMNDVIPGTRVEGRVELDGEDIYAPATDI